jgi:FtsH-binding integral membrane protein|tara:strand:+ start:147 stop:413 length:267 start_codon:yes stop_codon:yes gene_type:complete
MTANADAIAPAVWSSMALGLVVTGIGYYIQKFFPIWLSGLMLVVSIFAFIVLGFVEETPSTEILLYPLWLGFSLTLVLLGTFTIRRKN